MDDTAIRLTSIQRELLVVAHESRGEYFLRDKDPRQAEKWVAVHALCNRSVPLFRRAGFRSDKENGGLYFELTKDGAEVARVVGAP